MAIDKLVDSSQLDNNLTLVANAIRAKGGTSASLSFPTEYITAINAISGSDSGYTRTVVVPEQIVTPVYHSDGNINGYSAQLNNTTEMFEQWSEYIVTFNGTEYYFTTILMWSNNYLMGEQAYLWRGTSETVYPYPFCVIATSINDNYIYTASTDSVTVKIEKIELTGSGGGGTPTETLLGNTPYTLLEDANIKLVGDGSYTYSYTGTIADFEDRQNVTGTGAILTDEGSYYQLTDNGSSAWYGALVQMSFDGLTVGSSYTITVSGAGDGTTSTSGYWVIRDAGGNTTYGTINPLAGVSSLTFEATTTSINVMLGCADSTSWDDGIRTAKFTDMVITGAVEGSGSGEVALGQLTAGTQITSSPSVEVYAIIESSGETLRGKTCVCLGDSVTGLMAPPNDYPSVLASNTGMTVINGGFEGCRMSDTHPTATYAAFSAVKLADAIATGIWTTQDANISGFESGSYAPSHLTALKAVNWSNVDYITVEFGGNDAGDQYVYIDNTSNPTDTTTYVGAARYVYNRIHTAYPNIKIMFFVPMYRYWISEGKDSDEMTFTLGSNTYHYYDWGDALIASPPASGVPVIDMYRTLGINASNRTTYLLTSDQTHPSVAGCELIAQKFQTELTNHFLPSGGGSSATLITKTITANGTYNASDDSADGYSEVVVNVSSGSETTYDNIVPLQTINCTIELANGAYGGYITNYTEYISEGQKYRVIFDGVEYTPLTTAYYGSGTTYLYVGDSNVEASSSATLVYPFEVMLYNGQTFYLGVKGNGSHTLQVDKITTSGGSTNPLSGKILSTTGDSITAGAGNNGTGYPEIVASDNSMIVQNVAIGGGTVAYVNANTFCISRSISSMRSDADFILLEGGGNDADSGVPLGTLSSGYTATLDDTTFAGAIESMFKNALARFPDKKIGYVFIHKCASLFDSRVSNSYYDMAKSACKKWGIPYLDLNTQVPPLNYIADLRTTYTANSDGYHPNELGYRTFYVPKITAFLNTMLTDNSLINKIVTANGTYLASDDDADGYSSVTVNIAPPVTWETMADQTCTITTYEGMRIVTINGYNEPLSANETYRITWGDDQYICNTIVDTAEFTQDGYLFGNISIFGSQYEDTGEPFVFYRTSSTRLTGVTNDTTSSSVYVKIEKQVTASSDGITPTGTVSITTNGTHDVTNYASASVSVAPNLQSKSATPTTSSQTVSPDSGYDGLSSVTVGAIPSQYIVPTGNKAITENGNNIDVAEYATVSISVSGSSMNVQTQQSTTRRNNTALGSVTSLTCSKAGTYDVYWSCARSSTSGTWGSQLYINGTAYGTENTTFSNNVQNNHLTGVTISANATVAIYGRSRSGYYIYVPQLTIIQTA